MSGLSDVHWSNVIKPRGIGPDIAFSGRYVSYQPSDAPFLGSRVDFGSAQKKSARVRAVKRGPGILIIRAGIDRFEKIVSFGSLFWYPVEQPVSQLRPDHPPEDGRRYINLEGYAKGIDINPLFRPLFKRNPTKSVTWFCMEGTFKADAALSEGFQAMGVPSVTLWDSRDFCVIGPLLRKGPLTLIVSDSDWATNPDVWNQALRCVERMQAYRIPAVHVAPRPLEGLQKTGLDDVVGSPSWKPSEDMLVVPRMPQDAPARCSPSAKALYRWLLGHRRMVVEAYPKVIAQTLVCTTRTVWNAAEELERLGKLEVTHGAKYTRITRLRPFTQKWDTTPNRYRLIPPEPLTLSELGWNSELLAYIRKTGKAIRRSQEELRDRTMKAFTVPVQPIGCAWCGRPMKTVRATRKFCGPSCRKASSRAQEKAGDQGR